MIGFPYHASELYFHKIAECFDLVVVENNVASPYEIVDKTKNEHTRYAMNDDFDKDMEEIRSLTKAFDQSALCSLLDFFGDEIIISEEDYWNDYRKKCSAYPEVYS